MIKVTIKRAKSVEFERFCASKHEIYMSTNGVLVIRKTGHQNGGIVKVYNQDQWVTAEVV